MRPRLLLTLASVALVAADLARPYLEPGIPVWQVALFGAWLAVVDAEWRARGTSRADRGAIAALLLFVGVVYLRHSRSLDADGLHYFAHLRSWMADFDTDLANDYSLLGVDPTTRNVLPVGAPLVWGLLVAPLFWLSHAGVALANTFGLAIDVPLGTEPAFVAAACLVSIAAAACGLLLLYGELRSVTSPLGSLTVVALILWGTPLRFYMRVLPSFAHAIEFLGAVGVLYFARRLRDQGSGRIAFATGLACALTFLARSQDGLLLLVPLMFLLNRAATGRRPAEAVRAGVSVVAGFCALAWFQSAIWLAMFGTPVLVPHKLLHGEAFVLQDGPRWLDVLFSERGGLLASHPFLVVALVGLAWMARREGAWVAAGVVVFVAMWRVNASIFDWWQVRRFTGVLPLLALGLVPFASALSRSGWIPCAAIALLALRYDVALDRLRTNPGVTAPVRAVVTETADGLVEDLYRLVEPLAPGAAVAALEGYLDQHTADGGAESFDLGDGRWGRLPRPARGFSKPEAEDGRVARWVSGREARVFLPLASAGELRIVIEVRSIETVLPQRFAASLNGIPLGAHDIGPVWTTARFIVPSGAARSGTNELVLNFERAPIFYQVRSREPREPRSAAIARILVHASRDASP